MNKSDLIDTLATRLAGDKKTAAAAVEGLIDVVSRAVSKGEKVQITGFGVFEKRLRSARTARNPRTGVTIRVKKTSVPAFRPGQQFKDVVSGAKKLGKVATAPVVKATSATRTSKSTTAQTPAKSSATKTPAKSAKAAPAKAGTKSTSAKSTAAKSTSAKSTVAKSTAAKSTASKSAATKKTAAAKAPAKKTATKRSAAKKSG